MHTALYKKQKEPDRFQDLSRRSSDKDRSVQIVHEDRGYEDQRTQSLEDEGKVVSLFCVTLYTHRSWYKEGQRDLY